MEADHLASEVAGHLLAWVAFAPDSWEGVGRPCSVDQEAVVHPA